MAEGAQARSRKGLAGRMSLLALGIAFGTHALLWGGSMGLSELFDPELLLFMVGPALLPTLGAAGLIALSPQFEKWTAVLVTATVVSILEHAVFWTWRGSQSSDFGLSILYLLPILAGWPLALVCYRLGRAWADR